MEFYEITALMKFSYYKNMEDWEQSRMVSFITAKSNGAKIGKMEELMKFSWEQKEEAPKKKIRDKSHVMTDEEMKEYDEKAKRILESGILLGDKFDND